MRRFSLYCFIFLITVPCLAQAQSLPSEKPPIFKNFCDDDLSPAAYQACMNERAERAQDKLNMIFEQVSRQFADREALNQTQNAWIAYRNLECVLRADQVEEARRRSVELQCISELTERRALSLFALSSKKNYKSASLTDQETETIEESANNQ